MWVMKNNQEIAEMQEKTIPKLKKKMRFYNALGMSIVLLLFLFLHHKFGLSYFGKKPKPWNEVFVLLPRILAYSFLLFCVSYLFLFRKETIDKVYMCPSCQNKTNKPDKNMQCKCGGEYIDMDFLKWVEDEPSDKESENQQDQTPSKK
jgi:hypothetical protein